jgi:hypothetical protein
MAALCGGDMRPGLLSPQPNHSRGASLFLQLFQTVVILFPRMMAYPLSPTLIIGVAVPLGLRQYRPLNPSATTPTVFCQRERGAN